MSSSLLQLVQELPTSGARAVVPFRHRGVRYLVVPQLAADQPDRPPSMVEGDSNAPSLLMRWQDGRFVEHQRLAITGGEDAEFFEIGSRAFVATASLRSGSGPYEMAVDSVLFEMVEGQLQPFQHFATVAAKQCKHFSFEGRHFLALAQGASGHGTQAPPEARSQVYEWDGTRFEPFQSFDSAWGYNWVYFEIEGQRFLGYADHIVPSQLYRWRDQRFEPFQTLDGSSGRAFCAFQAGGQRWLAFANLLGDTLLYRWNGQGFEQTQTLSGPGGREFEWLPDAQGGGWLVQVNFIRGTREAPLPALDSVIYRFEDERLVPVESFATSGGTDAASFEEDGVRYLAVSNSLSAQVRYATSSRLYAFQPAS